MDSIKVEHEEDPRFTADYRWFTSWVCNISTPQSEVIQAPKDRVFAYQENLKEKSGIIFVTRDQGFSGGGCFYGLWIDAILSARLDVGERAKFIVPIGEHILKAGRDPKGRGLCSIDGATSTQRETMIRDGETKYFRYLLGADGVPDIQRTD